MATSYQQSESCRLRKYWCSPLIKEQPQGCSRNYTRQQRPPWLNISLYYSFQHNRWLPWCFSLILGLISADKIKKCFALRNIIRMPELENPWELSRPGGTFVAFTETTIPPAQVFQQKNTQIPVHKGSEVLNSVSQCGKARKALRAKIGIHTVKILLHPQNEERKGLRGKTQLNLGNQSLIQS